MCWQCYSAPDKYLPDHEGGYWAFGDGLGDGILTITWCGKTFHTNPAADWDFAGEAIPGDNDADGLPFFFSGPGPKGDKMIAVPPGAFLWHSNRKIGY